MNYGCSWVWVAAFVAVPLLSSRDGFAQATPMADQFAAGASIVGVTNVSGSSVLATSEPGEPAHCGEPARASVWAKWTAVETGTYTVTTSNSTFDTVLAVYMGTTLNNLKTLVTNDDIDFRTLTSEVRFRAYAGETFHIAVDGVGGARGSVQLNVGLGGPAMGNWSTVDPYGRTVNSSDFRNPVLLVDFWETTCGACVDELPDLVRLQRTLTPTGFSLVGFSLDLVIKDVVDFLNIRDEVNYPMMMNSSSAAAGLLGGSMGAPTKYLVDQERRIVARYLGGHDPVSETYSYYLGQLVPLLRPSSIVRLAVERQSNSVRVSWPYGYGDAAYRLEASSAALTGWTVASGVRQTNNGRVVVTLPAGGPARFFRLTKP